jgi:hypothetical protein
MSARIGTDAMIMTDALDMTSVGGFIYSPMTQRTTTEEVAQMRRKAS